MRILFYFGHPSQYHFLKNPVRILRNNGHSCEILIKSKDVLEKLLIDNNEPYTNILPEGRKPGKTGIIAGLIKRDIRLWRYIGSKQYNLIIGTDPSLAQVGFLKRIPVITVLEDDIDVIPGLARITFPFTSMILTPAGCRTGTYEKKTIHYQGFMKLAYLHPNRFRKEAAKLRQPYFLIRVSRLDAYHDAGITGFAPEVLKEVIKILERRGTVYLSAEGILYDPLRKYELKTDPSEMHQVLANAALLISDSQSMTMEAAMLGIPSVRFSDFAGRISVLEELEHKYGLTYGIKPGISEKLYDKINELLSIPDCGEEFERRRTKMLDDKIDVTAFLVWFIENYPGSAKIMKENPDYQLRYK